MNNVNGIELDSNKVIGAIILPKEYDSFKVLTDYKLGEKPHGFNNVFAENILKVAGENSKVIDDIYSINGNGLIALKLNDEVAKVPKVKKAILKCLDEFVNELTGIPVTPLPNKVLIDKNRFDLTYQNGDVELVSKSPVDTTSLLMQNLFESAPAYSVSNCNKCRVDDKYIL